MTNDMNEAMERAARAIAEDYLAYPNRDWQTCISTAQATIVAFLRSAPSAYQAMTTQLADEIEGMNNGQ